MKNNRKRNNNPTEVDELSAKRSKIVENNKDTVEEVS